MASDDVDVAITEIGGTVGDIESQPFMEAIRQFALDVGKENCLFIHLTLVPYLKAAAELKTKPTQHSVKELQSIGIAPDILVCRSEQPIPEKEREKIALFCKSIACLANGANNIIRPARGRSNIISTIWRGCSITDAGWRGIR